jgi:ZIP family zinc transporter
MSTAQLWILGAIAGFTIFLGLPVGRIQSRNTRVQALLNAIAIGVLVFLFWDILSHATETVETALTAANHGHGSWGRFVWLAFVLIAGLAIGFVGLVAYEKVLSARPRLKSAGAAAVADTRPPRALDRILSDPATRLAFFIAVGIGLHNFAEGLAIGQSAANGEVSLALLLIIGFGLHNATEGFGIVAPMAAEGHRPSIPLLVALGLIGGGPTFIGTIVGHAWVNDVLFLAFLALAAGSILYVTIQLVQVASKLGHRQTFAWGVLIGLVAGLVTDWILVAAGA